MTEYIIICLVALLGSGLTLFSGFGLGTILLPVFGLFFPIELAIVMTAIVHFLNNIFKLALLGKYANRKWIIRFGIPSVVAAFIGAWLLTRISTLPPLFEYMLAGKVFFVTPVKLVIAILLAVFALFDIIPRFKHLEFDTKYLPIGGFLSGFLGGLSGLQGALRSAFLVRAGLSKEVFIATGVVIACMVDISRLTVYISRIIETKGQINFPLIAAATLFAFLGAYAGNKLLKKVTIKTVQYIVAIMLLVFAVLLGSGII